MASTEANKSVVLEMVQMQQTVLHWSRTGSRAFCCFLPRVPLPLNPHYRCVASSNVGSNVIDLPFPPRVGLPQENLHTSKATISNGCGAQMMILQALLDTDEKEARLS